MRRDVFFLFLPKVKVRLHVICSRDYVYSTMNHHHLIMDDGGGKWSSNKAANEDVYSMYKEQLFQDDESCDFKEEDIIVQGHLLMMRLQNRWTKIRNRARLSPRKLREFWYEMFTVHECITAQIIRHSTPLSIHCVLRVDTEHKMHRLLDASLRTQIGEKVTNVFILLRSYPRISRSCWWNHCTPVHILLLQVQESINFRVTHSKSVATRLPLYGAGRPVEDSTHTNRTNKLWRVMMININSDVSLSRGIIKVSCEVGGSTHNVQRETRRTMDNATHTGYRRQSLL